MTTEYTINLHLPLPDFATSPWHDDMNNALRTIDAVVTAITGLSNLAGVWQNSTAYEVGDRTVDPDSGTVWQADVAHTSAASDTFADDRSSNPTYWLPAGASLTNRGAWEAETGYVLNDLVYDTSEYVVALCTTAHTSSAAPDTIRDDASNWIFISDTKSAVVDAETAQTAAAASASLASEWASEEEDTEVSGGEFSAKHYSLKSSGFATASSGYATTASGHSDDASTAADASAASASTASGHKDDAETAKTAAETARDLAQEWANEDEDTVVDAGEYSAKHYAAKSAQSASNAAASGDATSDADLNGFGINNVAHINDGQLGKYNYIINGDFDIWQQGATAPFSSTGWTADQWHLSLGSGASVAFTRETFDEDDTSVPGKPTYYAELSRITAGSADTRLQTPIENVSKFSGREITVTLWAKANSNTQLNIAFDQYFGTGGSPSSAVNGPGETKEIGTSWAKYTVYGTMPSVAGKTFGSNDDDYTLLRLAWAHDADNPVNQLHIAHVSVVIGDAREEEDAFTTRSVTTELQLCQRYFCRLFDGGANDFFIKGYNAASQFSGRNIELPVRMRELPSITKAGTFAVTNCSQPTFAPASVDNLYMQTQITSLGHFILNTNTSDDFVDVDARLF